MSKTLTYTRNELEALSFSEQITVLFKRLRQTSPVRLIARKNFSCCRSCGGAALGRQPKNHLSWAVFYSVQSIRDVEDPDEPGVYLTYGPVICSEVMEAQPLSNEREQDLMTQSCGQFIVETARALGFTVTWDGSPHTSIFLEPVTPEPTFLDLVGASRN